MSKKPVMVKSNFVTPSEFDQLKSQCSTENHRITVLQQRVKNLNKRVSHVQAKCKQSNRLAHHANVLNKKTRAYCDSKAKECKYTILFSGIATIVIVLLILWTIAQFK